ncbi:MULTISPECIES: hypothetical protein [Cyanophyceae]|uniref:hypothetical protein n=1 Tax=Cyanophyceae TaxID=3028117 RepID=UPI0013A53090|nr:MULTISPECIES: hypothetical protein [Cyanophyceae]MDB9305120.1 hypothetical protein [Nodularia spumigena CS-591/12]MDB9322574.1 hypothetical protein [Nodularia spumigena CS-591/07A]MDB9332892.1 hypothetical protein [Nodularia spumigena CS-591/04]MDB9339724.1 hypothetical protein [Nodularia spumigena CS-589/07]MDB9345927.1 hypothetical protein [Nodularia spumigena CS-588/06]
MKSKVLFYGLFIDFNGLCHLRRTLRDMYRTYATIAKNLDLSNRQVAKNAKKT